MKIPNLPQKTRLDRTLKQLLSIRGQAVSVREIRLALKEGRILINGHRAKPGAFAEAGAEIDLSAFVARSQVELSGNKSIADSLKIVFEDDELLVVEKPPGLDCGPVRAEQENTLLHGVIYLAEAIGRFGEPLEAGLLHRLDRATSGLVMFGKSSQVHTRWRRAFSEHRIQKKYLALVDSSVDLVSLRDQPLEGWIGPGEVPQRVRVWDEEPNEYKKRLYALSELSLIEQDSSKALVEVSTNYGRRHQVRAQLAHAGFPIWGDEIYGGRDDFPRLALHAAELVLPDGRTFVASAPASWREFGG